MNWDPLHELVALHERATRRSAGEESAWAPSVDLLETGEAFLIVVELPGIAAGDFSITASANGLVLSGQRPATIPAPKRFLRMERGHGRFSRSFSFGEPIDPAAVKATFERGLLQVCVPKAGRIEERIAIR
jgi:HSP20 family protein